MKFHNQIVSDFFKEVYAEKSTNKCSDCKKELNENNKANEETCLSCHEKWAETVEWRTPQTIYED